MVELASGPPFRFGEIRVSGVRRYSDTLVENLSPFRAGEEYDRDKLLVYQRRLLESGYFVSVQADIEPEDGKAEAALVRVNVIEAAKHHFEAGIGYSTDAGPRLELRYSNQDVLSSAWRFRSALRLDDKVRNLQFDFDSPPRPGGRWNSLFARAREGDIQNERTTEVAAGVSHNWGAELTPSALIVSAHAEEQRLAGDVDRQPPRGVLRASAHPAQDRRLRLAALGLPGAVRARRRAGGARIAAVRARRDQRLVLPAAGPARRPAAARPGRDASLPRAAKESPVPSFSVPAATRRCAATPSKASACARATPSSAAGASWSASSEYTHWVGDNWGVAAFVDAGNAWDDTELAKAVLGYGLGARLRTPIGPIRADLAYGQQTHQIRLHFSVGFTF